MKTKAAVCWKAAAPCTVEEIDVCDPTASEVRIRLAS
jgi:Zn-dependent alcohol dehydrogenase